MSTYVFSLQRVLDARRAEERMRAQELSAALQLRAGRERRLEGLLADEVRAKQVKRAVLERATVVEELLRAQRWLETVGRGVESERAELARLEESVARRRGALMEARAQVRALETLEERRRADWERRREVV